MANPVVVEKSCFFLANVSCYELVKDFSGPVAAILVAFFTVRFAFMQIAKQHQNTLNAQKEESKRNTRIEFFKDLTSLLDQTSVIIREANTFCMVKKYSSPQDRPHLSHQEYLGLSTRFNQGLLAVVGKVESHEIINPRLFRVFRFALQSIVHDMMKVQHQEDPQKTLDAIIELTNDAQMYLSDFQICLQNFSYSEVFDSEVPHRVPADKRYKVITNDPKELDSLLEYFSTETNWGKSCLRYEKEAKEMFSS